MEDDEPGDGHDIELQVRERRKHVLVRGCRVSQHEEKCDAECEIYLLILCAAILLKLEVGIQTGDDGVHSGEICGRSCVIRLACEANDSGRTDLPTLQHSGYRFPAENWRDHASDSER